MTEPKYKPKRFQSVDEATATVDWLLRHNIFHVLKNWFIALIHWRSGHYDFHMERK